MARRQKKPRRITTRPKRQEKSPFLEHVHEFRRRLVWVSLVVVSFAVVGYTINERLINFLMRPAKDQDFIYTTPGGGLNFIIQISIYFGIVVGIPVIIYHVLRYLEPLLSRYDRGFVMKCAILSAMLALGGMAFGYFVGLPAALVFLGKQFETDRITALFTLSDYMSFVTVYMLGAALMFQIPVALLFANRVKPLSARKLATSQRYVIIAAFIAAAIITPTPDLFNQAIIAIPIIMVYQLGVLLVASQNRYSPILRANRLRTADQELWQHRQETAAGAIPLITPEQLPDHDDADTPIVSVAEEDEAPVIIGVIEPEDASPPAARTIAVFAADELASAHSDTSQVGQSAAGVMQPRTISVSQLD